MQSNCHQAFIDGNHRPARQLSTAAQCGALMRNVSVIEGEEGRAGSK